MITEEYKEKANATIGADATAKEKMNQLVSLGIEAACKGDKEDAIKILSVATKPNFAIHDPIGSARAHLHKGYVEKSSRRHDSARASFDTAGMIMRHVDDSADSTKTIKLRKRIAAAEASMKLDAI